MLLCTLSIATIISISPSSEVLIKPRLLIKLENIPYSGISRH